MTTLTITIPDNAKSKLSNFVKELGGEIVTKEKKQLTKKHKLLKEIELGLKEVKAIRDGKLQPLSMDDLLNGK